MTHDEQYAKPIPGYRVPLRSESLASLEARALAAAEQRADLRLQQAQTDGSEDSWWEEED